MTASVRVAMVTWRFPEPLEPFVTAEAVGLADRGHHVRVVAEPARARIDPALAFRLGPRLGRRWRPPPTLTPRSAADGARLVTAGLGRDATFTVRALRSIAGAHRDTESRWEALTRTLPFAGLKPEVVYFQWANMAAQHLDLMDTLDARMVVACRGSDLRLHPMASASLARRTREALGRADAVICVSEEMARQAEALGLARGRATVTATGVDTDFFDVAAARPRRTSTDDGVVRLVSVGRLHWIKGYDYALDAVRILRGRGHDVRYMIAGQEDGAGGAVDLAVRDLDLGDVVERVGHLSPRGVRNLLSTADVFVLPSLSEGLCSAALEAMAMGLPVVTTDVGGMAEAVRDGVDGLVVPPRDPGALADAVERLIKDAPLRIEMGDSGAARVRERFSFQHHLDTLEAVIVGAARP